MPNSVLDLLLNYSLWALTIVLFAGALGLPIPSTALILATVEITDDGPGIPRGLRERIFEPFFTPKPVGEGTGLGLDIARRIVTRRHGGDMRVDSKPGETRFSVRLPIEAEKRDGG